jgi:hypothetical protein
VIESSAESYRDVIGVKGSPDSRADHRSVRLEITLGEALVAAGTLALAGFTWRLARQTRSEVGLSRETIELTQQSIEAQDMPFVIAHANPGRLQYLDKTKNRLWMWWQLDEDLYSLQVRLWNIGKGPAIARDVRLVLSDDDVLFARPGRIGEIVIEPGQGHDFTLPVNGFPPAGEQLGVMRVYYAHSSGTEYMTVSHAKIGEGGVHCSNFERKVSDGEGRSVVG